MIEEEVLCKEEEKHQLVKTGIIADWQTVANRTIQTYYGLNANVFDKRGFLSHFYQTIQYGSFILKERSRSEALKKHWQGKASVFLLTLQAEKTAPLDKEMKVTPPLTVAYCLSDTIYHTIYSRFCKSIQTFEQPEEVHSFFSQELRATYPLYIDTYMEALKKDDSSLWNTTCQYLQDLSYKVTRYVLANSPGYQDIIRDHTWNSVYELARKRLVHQTGNVLLFHTGADFRNYIIKSCHFIIDNSYKKYAGKEQYVEDISLLFAGEEDSQPCTIQTEIKELEIDVNNAYEVAHAVSIILLNMAHPLHGRLIEGIEDKVRLLLDKAVQGLSYNEIVEERNGAMAPADFQRAVVKLRKDYERIRKALTDKLIGMVKERKNKSPFLSQSVKSADDKVKKQHYETK
ncbi:hypothetical protein AGMMS49574_26900 [Bacteroidia bacterium]|nr:hypothetical protein AGMMS49574_26900 [Bacteroidia bacterium]